MVPWIEKYRPQTLENIILSPNSRTIINNILNHKYFPNIIFYGPPGTGKTTTVLCLIKKYQEYYNCKNNIIHLNASDERGIDVIRNNIYQFISNTGFFNNELKFVILDEVDSMTIQAQKSLQTLIFKEKNIRFCLICNYISKIIPSLVYPFFIIQFNGIINYKDYLKKIIENENINITDQCLDDIIFNYNTDMRSIINCLQCYKNDYTCYINETFIGEICNNYSKEKHRKYLENIYLKDFLYKLFFYIFKSDIPISSEIILQMKNMILNDCSLNYFENCFIKKININN
jgi:replication factor C subunit 3/5